MMRTLTLLVTLTAAFAAGCVSADDIEDLESEEAAVLGIEPDEIDKECEPPTTDPTGDVTTRPEEGVEPDEIDCDGGDDPGGTTGGTAGDTGGTGRPTYGPVITIKPKG